MKVLLANKPGEVFIREIETPVPKPWEVLSKVAYTGICGTDFEIVSGNISFVKSGLVTYPVRLGHEWSGVIESVGEGVRDFVPGDRVISDNWASCGQCEACLSGRFRECGDIRAIGTVNAYAGAFAEYMLLPHWHIHRLPENLSLAEGALIEPVTIANHAMHRCRILRESGFAETCTSLVIGAGGIGLSAVELLKCYGARRVLLAGSGSERLKRAAELGADIIINVSECSFAEELMRVTDGRGADVCIDTSGHMPFVRTAASCMRPYGELVLLAFYKEMLNDFNLDILVNNAVSLIGVGGQMGLSEMIQFAADGKLKLMPLISHIIPFGEAPDYLMNPEKFGENRMKALVKFD